MVHARSGPAVALLFALALVMPTAGCSSSEPGPNGSGGTLQVYADPHKHFTLENPLSWTVSVGDDVQVRDTAHASSFARSS